MKKEEFVNLVVEYNACGINASAYAKQDDGTEKIVNFCDLTDKQRECVKCACRDMVKEDENGDDYYEYSDAAISAAESYYNEFASEFKAQKIAEAKNIARNTLFRVQASYCGHSIPDSEVYAFENDVYELIKNASDEDFETAYAECIACGLTDEEVTAQQILCTIGGFATCYETLCVESVNVIKEK